MRRFAPVLVLALALGAAVPTFAQSWPGAPDTATPAPTLPDSSGTGGGTSPTTPPPPPPPAAHVMALPPALAPGTLPDAISVSPAPHVNLRIPKGWFACDGTLNAQLGGIDVPAEFRASFCGPTLSEAWQFRVINLNLAQLIFAIAIVMPDPHVDIDMFDKMSPDTLHQAMDVICARVRQAQGFSAPDCAMTTGILAGRTALLGSVTGSSGPGKEIINMRVVGLPMKGQMVLCMIGDTQTNHVRTGPIVDAIVSSISID